jgi:hypothetical protein
VGRGRADDAGQPAQRALLEVLLLHGAKVPLMSKWARFYYFKHDDIATFLMEPA